MSYEVLLLPELVVLDGHLESLGPEVAGPIHSEGQQLVRSVREILGRRNEVLGT